LKLYYEIKVLFAVLCLSVCLKKLSGYYFIRKPFKLYYDAVYKYSLKNAENLLKNKSFQIIFRHFVKSDELTSMLESDDTLSKNPQTYREMAEFFMNI